MLWNSVGSLTFLGVQWLITILVVRLSDDYVDAGVLALAMAIGNTFAPFANYQVRTYQISDVKHENAIGEYFALRMITSSLTMLAVVIYTVATSPIGSLGAVALYMVLRVLMLLVDVLHGCDQINGRMDYIGKSLMIQGLLNLVVFTAVFGLTSSLSAALAGMCAVTIVVGLFYDLPRTRQFERIKIGISRRKAAHLLKLFFPIVMAAAAGAAVPSIPRQFLSVVDGEAALGIYASVAALVTIIQMGAGYIYSPFLTVFARYSVEKKTVEFRRLFRNVTLGILATGVLCTAALEIVGPWLLRQMFGESIAEYTYLLAPTIAFAIVAAFVWFFSDLLIVLRRFRGNVAGNIIAVIVALPATYICVTRWDMNGVSFAGIAAYAVAAIVMAFYVSMEFRGESTELPPATS